ncbi:DUF308 domain-containing protein [Clostridium sp. D53t1_180928_C8]|uniref:DUF308 domain-containing protein n=1 Tax=Clostridium sp. D53t1_180928_C8 TaxID=2787101 RepID=UPI0018A8BD66|nr:DUF308 domain-containing protein [Clostridium sp. D53t1_180928_C8]
MKKTINKKIFSVILFIFIFSLVMPNIRVSASKNTDNYDVTISYGIDGKYRAQKYMPINIEVKNLSKDINGEIEVRVASDTFGGYDSYSKEVTATAGENINITIPVKFMENSTNGTICIVENNKVLYEKSLLISSGRISEGNAFTGVLTDDATALGYLGDITFSDSTHSNVGKMNLVKLNENLLSENGLNIAGLDLIVINNYNTANLKEEHYRALNNWVNEGGTLLIGAGANESKTINNINKSFLNISSSGTTEKSVVTVSENLNLILSQITFEGATVANNSNGNDLVYSLKRGEGKILVTTFDLGLEPFISSADSSIMLQNVLIGTFDKIYEQNNNGGHYQGGYEATNILRSIPVEKMLSTVTLGIILGVYAILVGIVLYFILKKMKRRDLTWALIPLTAIIFTVVIYLLGSKMKIKDVVVNNINIIATDEEGKGQVNGYIGIASKNKGDIKVEKEENLEMKYISDNNYYYGDKESESKNLRVKTTYTNNNSYFTVANNNISEMNKFKVSGKEIVMPKIENTLKIKNGNLEGNIKNNLDADIKKLIIVSGQSVWEVGAVSKGEEISITDLAAKSSFGIHGYADSLTNEYYESRWNDEMDSNDPKFKNVERYANLLNLLGSNDYVGTTTKIIAITDLPVDYSLKLDSNSVSNYDLTAVIQDANIDFKDENGNLNFPEGYFKYKVNYVDPAVYFDYYEGYVNGNGEVVLDYEIDSNVNVKEININVFTNRWGYQAGVDGEYYIYNYNTNQYEKFSLSSGSYKVINDGSYSSNNIIKIKIVADNEKETAAPQISIKGVEK